MPYRRHTCRSLISSQIHVAIVIVSAQYACTVQYCSTLLSPLFLISEEEELMSCWNALRAFSLLGSAHCAVRVATCMYSTVQRRRYRSYITISREQPKEHECIIGEQYGYSTVSILYCIVSNTPVRQREVVSAAPRRAVRADSAFKFIYICALLLVGSESSRAAASCHADPLVATI